jgi:hypothetical protein
MTNHASTIFSEYEREWPWLTRDEADDLVATGAHAINLHELGRVCRGFGLRRVILFLLQRQP